ncbi:MAG: M28 family peptidase [Chloroflexi bacterium]|nr:M28 family peptidase [Chloroflexota bacterium]MDA1145983.1 M28 family peptidase [Chloroflexota bacterium]
MPDPALAPTEGYTPARILQRIQTYEDLGIHHTGWPADDATSAWLIEELAAAGVTAAADRFAFPRVEVRRAEVRVGRDRIEGVPLHDGGFTDHGGIDGELCEDDDDDVFGKIVLATSALRGLPDWTDPALGARFEELLDRGCLGLILPRGDRDRQIVLRNAHAIDRPHHLPVLQIAPRDVPALQAQIMIRGEVVLEADGERLRSNATNVLATIEGSDPSLSPLGIVTPKSGWYTCSAERGGGIAIFLALAESLGHAQRQGQLPRTVHLLASSGHELDFYGARAYARTHRANIADAAAWLHLGASIGAREPRAAAASSDDALNAVLTAALATEEIALAEHRAPGPALGGEALVISDLGTRYVSFLGGHAYFHSPSDTVANAVDADAVARWARSSLQVFNAMLELRSSDD